MLTDAFLLLKNEFRGLLRDRSAMIVIFFLPLVLTPALMTMILLGQQKTTMKEKALPVHLAVEGAAFDAFSACLPEGMVVVKGTPGQSDLYRVKFDQDASGTLSAEIEYSSGVEGSSRTLARLRDGILRYHRTLVSAALEGASLAPDIADTPRVKLTDLTPERGLSSTEAGGMVPYLLILYIFSGVVMVGMAATAGEKEKGSFSLLLLNRVSRASIALGKISFVMVTGMANALASVLGFLVAGLLVYRLGIAKELLSGQTAAAMNVSPRAFQAILSPSAFLLFLGQLLAVSAIFASLIVAMGLKAKTMKEANGYVMPLLLLVILAIVPTMTSQAMPAARLYLIPILNTAHCLRDIVNGSLDPLRQGLCLGANLVFIMAATLVVRRLFSSEKILYTA